MDVDQTATHAAHPNAAPANMSNAQGVQSKHQRNSNPLVLSPASEAYLLTGCGIRGGVGGCGVAGTAGVTCPGVLNAPGGGAPPGEVPGCPAIQACCPGARAYSREVPVSCREDPVCCPASQAAASAAPAAAHLRRAACRVLSAPRPEHRPRAEPLPTAENLSGPGSDW